MANVKDIAAYLFFFVWFQVSHLGLSSFLNLFFIYIWCKKVVQFHSSACGCLVFPTTFVLILGSGLGFLEETVFVPLDIPSCLVVD